MHHLRRGAYYCVYQSRLPKFHQKGSHLERQQKSGDYGGEEERESKQENEKSNIEVRHRGEGGHKDSRKKQKTNKAAKRRKKEHSYPHGDRGEITYNDDDFIFPVIKALRSHSGIIIDTFSRTRNSGNYI